MDARSFVVLSLLVVSSLARDCEVGWAEYNGECFWFSRGTASWLDAQAACRKLGGYLATDDNQAKHDFLTNMASVVHTFGESAFWIGGDDYLFEGQWRWEESGSAISTFTKWYPGSPTGNTTMNCIAMVFAGNELMWKDMVCGGSHHGRKRQEPIEPTTAATTTKHHKPTHAHKTHAPRPPSPNHYYICEKQAIKQVPVIG